MAWLVLKITCLLNKQTAQNLKTILNIVHLREGGKLERQKAAPNLLSGTSHLTKHYVATQRNGWKHTRVQWTKCQLN